MEMCWRHAFLLLILASKAACSFSVPPVADHSVDVLLKESPSSSVSAQTVRHPVASPVSQSQPQVPETVSEPAVSQRVQRTVPESPTDQPGAALPSVRESQLKGQPLAPPPPLAQVQLATLSTSATSSTSSSPPKGSEEVVRDTIYGKVRGFVKEVLPGKFAEYYLGVPYAAPPVGKLRFENPVSPDEWREIRNCTTYPPACVQPKSFYVQDHRPNFNDFHEDCLYLNIYLSRTDSKDLRHVLAYIHGGSNVVGMAAMFDGDVLAVSTNVVVVMANYRLSNIGFLSMADPQFAGNYGLWDQVFALKWIQKNIKYFGGDPTKVTLSGHSAGGADVSMHILSDHAKGLFQYAICHSGTTLSNWALLPSTEDPAKYAREFAEEYSCNHLQLFDLKNCLKELKAEQIIKAGYNWRKIRPTYSTDNYGYLKANPEVLLETAPINAKAMMIGVTSNEGSAMIDMIEHISISNLGNFIKTYAAELSEIPIIADLLIQEYIPWDQIDPTLEISRKIGYSKFLGDYDIIYPSVKMIELLAERSFPVHLYIFGHRSAADSREEWFGVPHGEDIFYLFGAPLVGHPLKNYTTLDKEISKKYMTLFGNFIKTGKAEVDSNQFFRYTPKGRHYIKVYSENNCAIVKENRNLLPRRMEFWRRLIPAVKKKFLSQRLDKTHYENKLYFHHVLSSAFGVLSVLLICLTAFLLYRLRKRMTS
ncbi:acetylcholinesterase [Octopus bimaculoides]|uniref:Carboxylesterase type B domain-containing protein n=1 Tax=Octopus bimaculoides TaxID=37653 RepID=A0A0L8FNL8_OCTBM|nr:acetylcholinesterase [Octopus bimaculoides]|eukprot:XP_014788258.1 PREDICTED: acetylcholinesterase-like [Octopus bimaculoides]